MKVLHHRYHRRRRSAFVFSYKEKRILGFLLEMKIGKLFRRKKEANDGKKERERGRRQRRREREREWGCLNESEV